MNVGSLALEAPVAVDRPAVPERIARAPMHRSLRIHLCYLWRHRRLLDLADPQSFTERVQARKLFDRDPRLPRLTDKVGAKAYAADRLGEQWTVPTLWQGTALPEMPTWPAPFVVKSRHGCNQTAFVRGADEDWTTIRARSARWMKREYGIWLDEWAYRDVPRGLLVEPFVGRGGALPVDYKIYVFGGQAAYVQVHLERESAHRWLLFDRDLNPVSNDPKGDRPAFPGSIHAMIEAAEALGRDFDFVRCDFYDTDAGPRFGEFSFYPGSGLDPFDPVALDRAIGAKWGAALERDSRFGSSRKSDPRSAETQSERAVLSMNSLVSMSRNEEFDGGHE
ncbi:ATP-grasp fold amidoligase family protein [Novosphingopyxis sp.]|uniref:ATP-grasp fold amidoligase family protein n=1 Tax=Novosphingopyxis sp. TaxID=2709690 RepID=UPI003B5C0121